MVSLLILALILRPIKTVDKNPKVINLFSAEVRSKIDETKKSKMHKVVVKEKDRQTQQKKRIQGHLLEIYKFINS